MTVRSKSESILLVAGLLLLVAFSRMIRVGSQTMNVDEVWSVWQTAGTPLDIIRWTPYDWPPGYYLLLGAWRALVSENPIMLRYLSILVFLLGASCLYRAIRRIGGVTAGVLTMLAYGALGYSILLSIEVRGYALALGLMPLIFWLALRYFDHASWWRGIVLAISLVASFYVTVTSSIAALVLVVYTVIVFGRRVWRWWLPGSLAVLLALPEIVNKAGLVFSRSEATRQLVTPPFFEAMTGLYQQYAGGVFPLWLILLLAAGVLLFWQPTVNWRAVGLLLWVLGMPILMYVMNPVLGFFSVRYSWWVMVGLAAWVGWGLSRLPRAGLVISSVLLAATMFAPFPAEYQMFEYNSELDVNFRWLKARMIYGDVMVVDPKSGCGDAEVWDYYLRLYFPSGVQITDNPGSARRVWYVVTNGQQTPDLRQSVTANRVPGAYVGSARCFMQLYEAPPDAVGIPFENGMRFHGADILDVDQPWFGLLVKREGEPIHLRLWWSVDRPPERDYSVGLYALREADGGLIAESNAAPQVVYPVNAPMETSRWQPGQLYIEERELQLPFPTASRLYAIWMAVYFWQDGRRVAAPGQTPDNLLWLKKFRVKAW